MVYYFEIAPGDRSYQGAALLTYSFHEQLRPGSIVVVTLRTKKVLAIVIRAVKKPDFPTKKIIEKTRLSILDPEIQLFEWILGYYPSSVGAVASLFTPATLPPKRDPEKNIDVAVTTAKNELPKLTSEQAAVIRGIEDSIHRINILHGDTGTGKTRVYIELVKKIIAQKKSALILTPEISLTPQLAEQFMLLFPDVLVTHSGLTAAQRREIWLKIHDSDKPLVIIGPRSALFYPIKDLGIIIVDEFHDHAYKQEQQPRYHGLRLAGKMANLYDVKLIFGSATPPIEDYFYAVSKDAPVFRLTEKPAVATAKKSLRIINLRDDTERTKYSLLSKTLLTLIQEALDQKHQILLFLNKRGTARTILCQSCGWFAECGRCNIPYTYHHDQHQLICHTCNNKMAAPNSCPACSSENILFKNPGTKAIVESLSKIFPDAIIGRYDKDNKKSETFSHNKSKISAGEIDILVGTQLLVKGHDLPNLSLVGILLAESSLQFPDFTAGERTFDLLHQISGRVARSRIDGVIALQSYEPDNPLLRYAFQDENAWINFYNTEIEQRKIYNFPPFTYLLKIEVSRKTESSSEKFAQKLAEDLKTSFANTVEILEPAPAYMYKQGDMYRWHIIVKSKQRKRLLDIIQSLPKGCTYDIDPTNLL